MNISWGREGGRNQPRWTGKCHCSQCCPQHEDALRREEGHKGVDSSVFWQTTTLWKRPVKSLIKEWLCSPPTAYYDTSRGNEDTFGLLCYLRPVTAIKHEADDAPSAMYDRALEYHLLWRIWLTWYLTFWVTWSLQRATMALIVSSKEQAWCTNDARLLILWLAQVNSVIYGCLVFLQHKEGSFLLGLMCMILQYGCRCCTYTYNSLLLPQPGMLYAVGNLNGAGSTTTY